MPTLKFIKNFSSFAALNITQFCSAINDNIYKLLLVFLLINIRGAEHSNTILALAGAIFVIPFLLFASIAGTMADRFSKRSIIYVTRIIEILVISLGVVAIAFHSAIGGYAVLFLMATQSSLFSPAKYGIIPEIVKKEHISRYNGIMTATTYLAIILGTFLASFLSQVTHKNFFLASFACVIIAILGALSSLKIKKTEPQASEKKVSVHFVSEILKSLKRARQTRYLFSVLIFGAYFLFLGAYTQLNIIPFAFQSLHLSQIQGGYLFLMTAIGIGIGSFFAGRVAGKNVELGFVPLSALGISGILIALYFFSAHFYVVVPLLILLGILGGFYVIPIDSFVQAASPSQDRGQNVATGNFISFLGVIIASGLIALFGNTLELTAAEGFLIIGLLTLCMAFFLCMVMADQLLRLIVGQTAQFFWSLKVIGRRNVTLSPPVLLVVQRISWLDTIVVMATLPRLIRYIVPIEGKFLKGRSLFYRLVRVIPVDMEHFSKIGAGALEEVSRELKLGHTVCLMHPVAIESKTLKEWEKKLSELLKNTDVPIVPVHITRQLPLQGLSHFKQLKTLFKNPIKVSYGTKITR